MVKEGSLAAKLLEKQREEKGYFLKVVQSNEDYIQKAEEGEADAVAETLPVLEVLANKIVFSEGEKSFSKVGVRIYPIQEEEELCFIVSKGQNGEILRAFERGFRKLKEDGEYEALCERYGFSFAKTE
jgi:glutamine ABC superfamily ATP binding cassette transporter, permease/substrate-binding protein